MHILSPGMCVTDLLMSGQLTESAKFFINCLGGIQISLFVSEKSEMRCVAEHPSVPARHLVPLVRRMGQEKNGNGIKSRKVEYLTQTRAYTQIFKVGSRHRPSHLICVTSEIFIQ